MFQACAQRVAGSLGQPSRPTTDNQRTCVELVGGTVSTAARGGEACVSAEDMSQAMSEFAEPTTQHTHKA